MFIFQWKISLVGGFSWSLVRVSLRPVVFRRSGSRYPTDSAITSLFRLLPTNLFNRFDIIRLPSHFLHNIIDSFFQWWLWLVLPGRLKSRSQRRHVICYRMFFFLESVLTSQLLRNNKHFLTSEHFQIQWQIGTGGRSACRHLDPKRELRGPDDWKQHWNCSLWCQWIPRSPTHRDQGLFGHYPIEIGPSLLLLVCITANKTFDCLLCISSYCFLVSQID